MSRSLLSRIKSVRKAGGIAIGFGDFMAVLVTPTQDFSIFLDIQLGPVWEEDLLVKIRVFALFLVLASIIV